MKNNLQQIQNEQDDKFEKLCGFRFINKYALKEIMDYFHARDRAIIEAVAKMIDKWKIEGSVIMPKDEVDEILAILKNI